MAANMDVTIVDLVRNTGTVAALTAIADDTVGLIITPTKPCRKLILILANAGAAYTVDIVAGSYWAGQAMTQVAMGTEVRAFVFEPARLLKYQVNTAAVVYDYRIKLVLSAAATTTTTYQCLQLP